MRALPNDRGSVGELLEAVEDISLDVARSALRRLVPLARSREIAVLRERMLELDIGIVPDVAAALRELGDPDATAIAGVGLASASPFRRHKAAVALRELCDPSSREVLLRALDDSAAPVRRVAIEALGRLPPDAAGIAGCRRGLGDSDPSIRVAAVAALARIDPDASDSLRAMTRDPHVRVRRETASVSCVLAIETVRSLLEDRNADVRAASLRALVACADRAPLPSLLDRIDDPSWHVRRAACDALAAAGGDEAGGALVGALVDPHAEVRGRALVALERLHRDRLESALEDALADAAAPLRRALIEILGRRGRAEVARRFAGDPATDVRIAVAHALVGDRSPEARAALRYLQGDDDPAVRNAAATVIETTR